jgi:catechol 2,3-dioxygenase-like lactoylglutathione lyase family enzyme
MPQIRHVATCTNNNRRIARFYRLIFGMEELWNPKQNSPHAFYLTDGYVNLNCLQIHPAMNRNPGVCIEHFGFFVQDLQESCKMIKDFHSSVKLEDSPPDGRYEDMRFHDPEGNRLEIATNPWGTDGSKRSTGIRHLTIHAKNLENLADFYKTVFGMKEIARRTVQATDSTVLDLSDDGFCLSLIKNAPVSKFGIQSIGIQVPSIEEIEERLVKSPPFVYEGESPVQIIRRKEQAPYDTCYLRDPDGNYVDLSEKGWMS